MFFHSRDISPFPAIQLRLSYDDDDGDDGGATLHIDRQKRFRAFRVFWLIGCARKLV
jgi:hypothetical protein